MKKLVLTENELATIDNALRGLAACCEHDADSAPDTAEGRFLKIEATRSAKEYLDLANSLQEADEIVVDLS